MHNTLYTILYTLYIIHNTLYTIHYAQYTIHYSLCTIHYTLYTIYYTLFTMHYTLYIIHYSLYTIHYALCSIHYTLYKSIRAVPLSTQIVHPRGWKIKPKRVVRITIKRRRGNMNGRCTQTGKFENRNKLFLLIWLPTILIKTFAVVGTCCSTEVWVWSLASQQATSVTAPIITSFKHMRPLLFNSISKSGLQSAILSSLMTWRSCTQRWHDIWIMKTDFHMSVPKHPPSVSCSGFYLPTFITWFKPTLLLFVQIFLDTNCPLWGPTDVTIWKKSVQCLRGFCVLHSRTADSAFNTSLHKQEGLPSMLTYITKHEFVFLSCRPWACCVLCSNLLCGIL
jgi:hypothetical protein